MEEGPTFMGLPERWLDDPTWKCPNGHVSKWYIKSEAKGGDVCPASGCGEFVRLCAPEEVEQAQ